MLVHLFRAPLHCITSCFFSFLNLAIVFFMLSASSHVAGIFPYMRDRRNWENLTPDCSKTKKCDFLFLLSHTWAVQRRKGPEPSSLQAFFLEVHRSFLSKMFGLRMCLIFSSCLGTCLFTYGFCTESSTGRQDPRFPWPRRSFSTVLGGS